MIRAGMSASAIFLSFHNASLTPLLSELLGIGIGGILVYFILFEQQLGEVFVGEAFELLYFLPQICRRLVHADDIAEVDVFLALSHDNLLSTDVSQIKTWFCFHFYLILMLNHTGLLAAKMAMRSSSSSYWLSLMNDVHTRSPS